MRILLLLALFVAMGVATVSLAANAYYLAKSSSLNDHIDSQLSGYPQRQETNSPLAFLQITKAQPKVDRLMAFAVNEIRDLQSKNARLEGENQQLRQQNQELTYTLRQVKNEIEAAKASASQGPGFWDTVLQLLLPAFLGL